VSDPMVVSLLERIALAVEGKPEAASLPVKSVNLQNLPVERPSKKLQTALDWLAEHPEHLSTPSRQIADQIGVSHMTINKAHRILRGEE